MEAIKILITDDHTLFRTGLRTLLSTFPWVKQITEASNGKEFLYQVEHFLPDIALVDIEMPEMNGIDATREACLRFPGLKVVALSMYGEEDYYYKMIDAGAKGFLLKNSDISEVEAAIKAVAQGGEYFSQELLYSIVKRFRQGNRESFNEKLSQRELEVLQQICLGYSNTEIADNLSISKRTVDKHRENLLLKTNARNTAGLVVFAIKNKLIDL